MLEFIPIKHGGGVIVDSNSKDIQVTEIFPQNLNS